jgi:hypothetical protein
MWRGRGSRGSIRRIVVGARDRWRPRAFGARRWPKGAAAEAAADTAAADAPAADEPAGHAVEAGQTLKWIRNVRRRKKRPRRLRLELFRTRRVKPSCKERMILSRPTTPECGDAILGISEAAAVDKARKMYLRKGSGGAAPLVAGAAASSGRVGTSTLGAAAD